MLVSMSTKLATRYSATWGGKWSSRRRFDLFARRRHRDIGGHDHNADVGIGGTEAVGNQDLVSAPGNEAGGRGNSQAIGIAFA
jgi:hypothetical protein